MTSTATTAKLHQLVFNEDDNSRTIYREIETLGASILKLGVLTPLTVQEMGKGTYVVLEGFRRGRALTAIHYEGDIPIQIKAYASDTERLIANLTENTGRDNLHPADLSKRCYELVTGKLEDRADVVLEKMTVKQLATQIGLGASHVTNLVRIHKKLDPAVRELWGRHDIPLRTILDWITLNAEGQMKAFEAWKAVKDGPKPPRKARASKADIAESDDGEDREGGKDGEDEDDRPVRQPVGAIAEKLEALSARQEKKPSPETKGKIAALRWVLGDIATL